MRQVSPQRVSEWDLVEHNMPNTIGKNLWELAQWQPWCIGDPPVTTSNACRNLGVRQSVGWLDGFLIDLVMDGWMDTQPDACLPACMHWSTNHTSIIINKSIVNKQIYHLIYFYPCRWHAVPASQQRMLPISYMVCESRWWKSLCVSRGSYMIGMEY